MNVEKISTKKVSDSVAEQLEKLIESGKFQAGEKLPSVRELCEVFDVGRSAVRDALSTLKGRGLVNVKQGEGTFVCEFDSTKIFNNNMLLPNKKDISELFQVRKVLETGIAEMAALYRTDQDLNQINFHISRQDVDGWESDYNFHMAIAKATGNEILVQLMQFISTTTKKAMIDFHKYIEKNKTIANAIDDQHIQIYEAIKLGEADKASEMMVEHIDFVEELLQNSLSINLSK